MKYGTSQTPVLAEVIREAMEQRLSEVNTFMPAIVTKYVPGEQEVNVQPTLKIAYVCDDGTEGTDTLPEIQHVKVLFPRAGGFFLSMPIEKGDLVALVCSQRSLDEWSGSSGKVIMDPIDLRMHDISDAVAIPGLYPDSKALPDNINSGMAVGKERGIQLRITDSDTVEITSGGAEASTGGFVALADLVLTELQKIETAFAAHIHVTTATVGAGPTVGVLSPTATSIATLVAPRSTNLKAD